MKITVLLSPFGLLAFDESQKLIDKVMLSKDPHAAAAGLTDLENGKLVKEIVNLMNRLHSMGYENYAFDNNNLGKAVAEKLGVSVEPVAGSLDIVDRVRREPESLAIETGFVRDKDEFGAWMHDLTLEVTKLRVKGQVEKRDLIAAQAIQTLDELDRNINMLMTRVREWYGIYFPELDRLLEKHETYARLVVDLGSRDNFTKENLLKEDIPEAKSGAIAKVAEKSMGAGISSQDISEIQALCRELLNLFKLRQNLENYLDSTMGEVAPNMKSLVGSLLGARMIAVAGGLADLAKRPASTIQVLGAEKALFRSLKSGARPPKHGMIFQHTLLHDAKRWQRGKIARALAGKLAIAARADAFGGRNIADELKSDLEKRIGEIREKYEQPPPPSEQKPRETSRRVEFERRPFRPKGDREFRRRNKKRRHDRER